MARWRLKSSHYLNTPNTIWRRAEQTDDGQQVEKEYKVPLLLDVDDPRARYRQADGVIVTNRADPAHPRDVVFFGDPTPEMEPLDEEAEKISRSLESRWAHPINSLPSTTYEGPAPVSRDELQALKDQVAALMEQNAALSGAKPARRA